MSAPLTTGLELARAAVLAALAPIALTEWKRIGAGVAGKIAVGAHPGAFVVQSADGGGQADRYCDRQGWTGQLLIKAYASSPDAAAALLDQSVAPMQALAITDHDVAVEWIRPVDLPLADNIHGAAHQWRLTIHQETP